jgi:hypothetical protein
MGGRGFFQLVDDVHDLAFPAAQIFLLFHTLTPVRSDTIKNQPFITNVSKHTMLKF